MNSFVKLVECNKFNTLVNIWHHINYYRKISCLKSTKIAIRVLKNEFAQVY